MTRPLIPLLAGLLALLAAGAAPAQTPDPLSPEAEVRSAEKRRYQAMIDVDVPTLEAVLGDGLRFTHANGSVESKYEFIASLESGNLDYQSIETSDVTVRIFGDTAVVSGTAAIGLVTGGSARNVTLLYLGVYVRAQTGWSLVAYQSTQRP